MKWRWWRRESAEEGAAALASRLDLSGSPRRVVRVGMVALLLGFGGFMVWAATAPLDEGVPASGSVALYSQRKIVQHPTGGVVSKVLVREAQEVQAGDVLIELDSTQIQATYDALRKQSYALMAQQSRLQAERTGAPTITFDPELMKAKSDPIAAEFMSLQSQLFRTRRASFDSEMASMDEGIAGLEAQNRGLKAQFEGRSAQLALVDKQLKESRGLAAEGYLPRNKLYEEERLSLELSTQINDLQANLARTVNNIAELRMKREFRRQEYRRETESQLADVTRDLETTIERIRVAEVDLERTRIRAPVSGSVVSLQIQTVGGVIPPGGRLMEIVPRDEKLLIEVQVPPHLVDRIAAGMPADVRFHAFADLPNLVIDGRVLSVSADRLIDPNPAEAARGPYYLARVEVLPEGMKQLGSRALQPGMPADVLIKTGERSLLQYLMRPLIRRVSTSMTEH